MESAFRGTIYEPYDFLTDHTHAMVIHVNPSIAASAALRGKKRTKEEMQALSDAAMQIFRACIPEDIHIQRISVEGFLVLGLGFRLHGELSTSAEAQLLDRLLGWLENALDCIRRQLELFLQLSVSALHINTQNVYDAYRESFAIAVHFPFLQQSGQIILFRDFQNGLSPACRDEKRQLERQWQGLMEAGNYRDAEPLLLQIAALRASAPLTVTSLTQERISRMEFFGYQLCDMRDLPPGSQEALFRQIALIRSAKTMEELEQQLHRIYTTMAGLLETDVQRKDLSWSRKISAFVRNNYSDPTLNADRISRHFGLHPAYISHIFHQSTGMKLLDYIHTTRIDHIKRLLRSTNMSLEDIARKTGYYDRYSMSRVFRRYVGMPPSDYRRQ